MSPRGVHRLTLVALLGAIAGAIGCAGLLEPSRCAVPVISPRAIVSNPSNVLSAFISADVHGADSVSVRFGLSAALDSATPAFAPSSDSVTAPIFGLLPSTLYAAQLVASNHCGTAMSDVLPFATDTLPSDLPKYTATGPNPVPGYVVFGAGNYGLAIDNSGRVVWYHRFTNGPGLNFQVQPNGRYTARPSVPAGETGIWVEIAPDGSVTRTLGCAHGFPPRMHDMIAQADGSYWVICDEVRTMDLSAQGAAQQARVLGSGVQHRTATGDVMFEWSPFDHLDVELNVLDPVDRNAAVINWTHTNALDLDGDGALLLSFRNLNEVIKIDTRTGVVVWRMGGTHSELTFADGNLPAFIHQHGLRANGRGRVLLLDNLGSPLGSRAERYDVDEVNHIARLSASFGSPERLVAQIGGNAQALPGGHTLVSFGSGAGVEEYDAAGNVVWKLAGNPGYVFRAQRIRSLYRPGVGDPR